MEKSGIHEQKKSQSPCPLSGLSVIDRNSSQSVHL